MATQNELRAFVFSVTYILIFSAFVIAMPTGLQGQASDADMVTPVDPALLSDFAESTNYTKSDFSSFGPWTNYYYDLGGYTWQANYWASITKFWFAQHVLVWGLWFGGVDECILTSLYDGATYGSFDDGLSLADIEADSTNGTASYDAILEDSGNSAGRYIFYYNETAYDNTTHAWDNDELYILHGMGLEEIASTNIMLLLLQVLFLQLPDVPVLLNMVLVSPTWACIAFLIWFIIKESLPFVS